MLDAITAETIYRAMRALRRGEITPDDFRALMRRSREEHGEDEHERLKVVTLSNFDRVSS